MSFQRKPKIFNPIADWQQTSRSKNSDFFPSSLKFKPSYATDKTCPVNASSKTTKLHPPIFSFLLFQAENFPRRWETQIRPFEKAISFSSIDNSISVHPRISETRLKPWLKTEISESTWCRYFLEKPRPRFAKRGLTCSRTITNGSRIISRQRRQRKTNWRKSRSSCRKKPKGSSTNWQMPRKLPKAGTRWVNWTTA